MRCSGASEAGPTAAALRAVVAEGRVGTHGWVWHAPARVRAPVRGAVPSREAAGRPHQPPARLHLVGGVHGA